MTSLSDVDCLLDKKSRLKMSPLDFVYNFWTSVNSADYLLIKTIRGCSLATLRSVSYPFFLCWHWTAGSGCKLWHLESSKTGRLSWDIALIYLISSLYCLPLMPTGKPEPPPPLTINQTAGPFIIICTDRQLQRVQMLRLNVFICRDAVLLSLWWWVNEWIN